MSFFSTTKQTPIFRALTKKSAQKITHPAFRNFIPKSTTITKEQQKVRDSLQELDHALEYEAVQKKTYEIPKEIKMSYTLDLLMEKAEFRAVVKWTCFPAASPAFQMAFKIFLSKQAYIRVSKEKKQVYMNMCDYRRKS